MIDVPDYHKSIEEIVRTDGCSYLEAAIQYCHENDIDEEQLGHLISLNNDFFKTKIQEEAEELNFLEKTDRLPV